jgi:hypothetical protein
MVGMSDRRGLRAGSSKPVERRAACQRRTVSVVLDSRVPLRLRMGEHPGRRLVATKPSLTDREVMVELARGLSTHLEHIYAKLTVSTRTQAALFAMQHGLVGAPAD